MEKIFEKGIKYVLYILEYILFLVITTDICIEQASSERTIVKIFVHWIVL